MVLILFSRFFRQRLPDGGETRSQSTDVLAVDTLTLWIVLTPFFISGRSLRGLSWLGLSGSVEIVSSITTYGAFEPVVNALHWWCIHKQEDEEKESSAYFCCFAESNRTFGWSLGKATLVSLALPLARVFGGKLLFCLLR